MANNPISRDHTLVRYCPFSSLNEAGEPTSSSFSLRQNEQYLSVNCLQLTGEIDLHRQLSAARNDLQLGLSLGAQACLATLGVDNVIEHVYRNTWDQRELAVLHEPPPHSHGGIHNMRMDDLEVEDLIAECVQAVYPAREP